jgi:hypothetical protein
MFQEPEDADPFGDCIVREAHNVAGRPVVLMLVCEDDRLFFTGKEGAA